MPRPNLANFSVGTLLTGGNNAGSPRNMTTTDTQFMLQTGQGSGFPAVSTTLALPYEPAPFVVCLDSELILCSARSGDLFTVWSDGSGHTGRGYDGTIAAAHTAGSALVVQSLHAGSQDRVYGVLGDVYNLDVPSYARGGFNASTGLWDWRGGGAAPGTDDEEFDWETVAGSWVTYPLTSNLPGGTDTGAVVDYGKQRRSLLYFRRNNASPNGTTYWAYKPFAPSMGARQSWAVRLSHGGRLSGALTPAGTALECGFFISSLSNPTGGNDVGDQVRLDHSLDWRNSLSTTFGGTTKATPWPFFKAARVDSSTYALVDWAPDLGDRYAALTWDGASTWYYRVGDGRTWRTIAKTVKTFTPASIGFRLYAGGYGGVISDQEATVDWLRAVSITN